MSDVVSETRSTYDQIAHQYAARRPHGYPGLAEDIAWFRDSVPTGAWVAWVVCCA